MNAKHMFLNVERFVDNLHCDAPYIVENTIQDNTCSED